MNRKGFLKSIAVLAVAPKIIAQMEFIKNEDIFNDEKISAFTVDENGHFAKIKMDRLVANYLPYGTTIYFDKFGKLIKNGHQSKTIQ